MTCSTHPAHIDLCLGDPEGKHFDVSVRLRPRDLIGEDLRRLA